MSKSIAKINKNFGLFRRFYQNFSVFRCYSDQCTPHYEMKGLCVGVYDFNPDEPPIFTTTGQKYNEQLSGKLTELVKRSGKRFHRGKSLLINNVDKEYSSLAIVGLGPKDAGRNDVEALDEALENVRCAAGSGIQLLKQQKVDRVLIDCMDHPEQAAEGAILAAYRYQELKMKENWEKIPTIEAYDCADADSFQRGVFKAECQNLARKLCEMPANILTPLGFAQETVNQLCPCGVKVLVHDRDWIENKNFNGFLHAARGSCEPPIVLEISYQGGGGDGRPVAFVGKGVTFDSGGVNLKPAHGMDIFRADMTGAASIVAAIRAAAILRLPINIEGVILLCENMTSSMAMKPGDIVTAMNGKTVRIADTDHEGRLILADGLVYAQQAFKPRVLIDVGSMAVAIRQCLGSSASGVFTNSKTLWEEVEKAGFITGDRVWRLPLWRFFSHRVRDYRYVDLSNRGKGSGHTCLAAGFLKEFIDCVDWIHFDTASAGYIHDHKFFPYMTKGTMSGRPTRTLIQLLHQLSNSDNKTDKS